MKYHSRAPSAFRNQNSGVRIPNCGAGAPRSVALLLVFAALGSPAFADWVSIGPDGGRLDAGCVSPHDPRVIYVAPYSSITYSRVHRSTDDGVSWQPLGTLPYSYSPYSMWVDPNHDSLVFATASGNRFLRSTDRGET